MLHECHQTECQIVYFKSFEIYNGDGYCKLARFSSDAQKCKFREICVPLIIFALFY